MAKCSGFRNFKERGEWVELQFMASAVRKHFKVSKPWGDSSPYDVGVEHGQQFLRVQVKSTSYRLANGYQCGFRPNTQNKGRYTTRQIDFFAAYIVPEDVWYILPAPVVLKTKSMCLMLCPVREPQARSDSYCFEPYREAWPLLRTPTPIGARRRAIERTSACHPEAVKSSAKPRTSNEGPLQLADGVAAVSKHTGPSARKEARPTG